MVPVDGTSEGPDRVRPVKPARVPRALRLPPAQGRGPGHWPAVPGLAEGLEGAVARNGHCPFRTNAMATQTTCTRRQVGHR